MGFLLLESGSYFLLENGGKLILEDGATTQVAQGGWGHRRGNEWDVRSDDEREREDRDARRRAVERAFDALNPEIKPGTVPQKVQQQIVAEAKRIAPSVDLRPAEATLKELRSRIDAVWRERQAEAARMRDDEEALIALLMA